MTYVSASKIRLPKSMAGGFVKLAKLNANWISGQSPGHSLIFNVDILDTVDEQIHEAIFGQSRCDYVAIGRDCANPYLLLIEVKGDKHPKPRRILRAKRQIKNSEAIVLTMMRDCHGIPLGLNVQHVVITRRIPASTMSRWQKLPSGENPFRGITLVFSGDDIWRTIYNT